MSSACVDYLLYQINENFGKDCGKISEVLLTNDWVTLKDIKHELKYLKLNRISEFLHMLINLNMVSFKCDGDDISLFEFNVKGALSFFRNDRYLVIIGHLYGEVYELIIEEFCKLGNLYSTQLFERVKKHFSTDDWIEKVAEATNKLIDDRILKVSPMSLVKNKSMNIYSKLANIEKIKEKMQSNEMVVSGVKRQHSQMEQTSESWDIQYCMDNERMDILCRNSQIIDNVRLSINENAAQLIELLINKLEFGAPSCYNDPVSSGLLRKLAKSKFPDTLADPDQFEELLHLLSQEDEDVCYIEQIRNASSTLLRVDFDWIIEQVVTNLMGDLAEVVFGANGKIVFDFLLAHDHIEETKFRDDLLISPAQLNTLIPAMLDRGFISRLELSKTKQYYDEPLTSLLFVDLERAVRNERETCYQTLRNLLVRRNHEEQRHQPLLLKMYEMSMKDSSFQTIDGDGAISVVTEKDRDTVRRLDWALNKLDGAEIAVDNSLVLFDAFIEMKVRRDNF